MGLENQVENRKLLEVGVKAIEENIDCLNCDKKLKEHSKNGMLRCLYVIQTNAVRWGTELRSRQEADQHQMAAMDKKQIEDIKADQALRSEGKGEFGNLYESGVKDGSDQGVHPVVATNEQGEEIRVMNNETEVPDDDPHKQKFLKDNPQWKTNESPLTDEQKKMLKEMEKGGGKGKLEMKSSGGVQTIKDGKPTGNKIPKKKNKTTKEDKDGNS